MTYEIHELLDRLEAAESTRRDDYQNWMTALDRNAELLAKLEVAEKSDAERIAMYRKAIAERDALRQALQGLLDALPSATTHPAINAARAAIARATGELP